MVAPIIAAGTRVIARKSAAQTLEHRTTPTTPSGPRIGFWLVLGFNILGDIIQLFALAIQLVGLATVAGIGISIFFMILMGMFTFSLWVVNISYTFFTGGRVARAAAAGVVSFLLEQIPGLNVLPMNSVTFYLTNIIKRSPSGTFGSVLPGKLVRA